MRIHSNEQIAFTTNRSNKNATQIEKSLQKLGSGIITTKGNNPSGLAISETMRTQIRGLAGAQSNMQDGLSLLESMNEGLINVNELLQRARELSVMTANDTLTDNDRKASQTELTQLLASVDDTAEHLKFNTRKILNDQSSLVLQVGANPGERMVIDLVDVSTATIGLANASMETREQAEQLITLIDNALETIGSHLTKVGSNMEAIEHHLKNSFVFENNLTKSLSLIEDTDVAKEMLTFITTDIRQKGDQLLLRQVNNNQHNVLSLFNK